MMHGTHNVKLSGATDASSKENLRLYFCNIIFHVETGEQKTLGTVCLKKTVLRIMGLLLLTLKQQCTNNTIDVFIF